MSVLLDTNVLLRIADAGSPDHATATAALLQLARAGVETYLVPQVIYEYWVVVTRPVSANGLGMSVLEAEQSVNSLMAMLPLLRDERGIFSHWQSLVAANDVKGKNAHDARLVAAMQRHGLPRLLTFNGGDFARYSGIEVLAPADVAAGR